MLTLSNTAMKHEPSEIIADITFAHATGQRIAILGRSQISVVRALSRGIDADIIERLQSEIPLELLCEAIDLSKTSLKRRIKLKKKLNVKQADNLLQLAIAWHALINFFNHDRQLLSSWLYTDLPAFDGATPASMLSTNFGRRVLKETLETMKYGEFF